MKRAVRLMGCAATVALGCASPTGRPLSDGGVPFDFARPHDLASGGADGGGGPPDMAVAAGDMAAPGCMQIAQWPGLAPQGGYDDQVVVTFAASADGKNPPFNALSVEDYHAMGAPYPKTVTYQMGDQYATCDVCTLLSTCDQMGCTPKYFAQAGQVTVTRADQNAVTGRMTATLKNLTLVEWDFTQNDAPVPNGGCIQVGAASFDVQWNNPPPDGGASDGGGGMPDGGGAADMATGCAPVVNELQTTGKTGSDEFVELYNPCQAGIDLTGWKLAYRSAGNNNGGADTTLLNLPANTMIASNGYLVVCGANFAGACDLKFNAGGLAQAGGAVGLRTPQGVLVDSIAYDTLTAANNFTETMPAPNPPANQSIARLPNGTDTNNNSADFKVVMTPTPKAANQ